MSKEVLLYALTLMSAIEDKRIQVLLPVDLWKAYRLHCFEQEVSMSDDVRKYITELLSKPRIAMEGLWFKKTCSSVDLLLIRHPSAISRLLMLLVSWRMGFLNRRLYIPSSDERGAFRRISVIGLSRCIESNCGWTIQADRLIIQFIRLNRFRCGLMNKILVVSLFSCTGSIAAVLATGTISNTNSAKTIPYPEVLNLSRVPTFNAQGMVPQSNIAKNNLPQRALQSPLVAKTIPTPIVAKTNSVLVSSLPKPNPAPITVDLVSRTVREPAIKQYSGDCAGCRNLSPSMMVLGYSTEGSNGHYGKMY